MCVGGRARPLTTRQASRRRRLEARCPSDDQDGKAARLSTARRKVIVLAFFPKGLTPVEPRSRLAADASTDLESPMSARRLGLDDVASHKAFVAAQNLTFPLLSDPDGVATAKFGA